jgi:hypothetical protein
MISTMTLTWSSAHADFFAVMPQYFWGHDGTTGVFGDWAYELFKGDCAGGTPIINGIGFHYNDSHTDALLCKVTVNAVQFNYPRAYTMWMDKGDARSDISTGDWAPGQYKGECGPTEMLVGIAQRTSGSRDAILCAPTLNRQPPSQCHAVKSESRTLISQRGMDLWAWQDNRYSLLGGDWDENEAKLQCANNEYVKGVSRGADNQSPVILCCAE